MALLTISGNAPALDANVPSATLRLGRHGTILKWWTPIAAAIKGSTPRRLADRIGGADLVEYGTSFPNAPAYGREYANFVNYTASRSNYFAAPVSGVPTKFSVVSLHAATYNGSRTWGVLFGDNRNDTTPHIAEVTYIQSSFQQGARISNGSDAIVEQFTGLSRPGAGGLNATFTVIDTTNWQIKKGRQEIEPVTRDVSDMMSGVTVPANLTFCLGSGTDTQGMGGQVFETMLISGDIYEQPELLAEIRAYFSQHYV